MTSMPRFALALLLLPATTTFAQEPAPACTGFQADSNVAACTCGTGPHQGSVWGSGPYTGDSDICTAAVHAGVLGPEGGQVLVMSVTPPPSFVGTLANGVQTSDWGAYDSAFVFYGGTQQAGVRICGRLGEETEMTCRCEAGRALGSVWGSGPYTADSDACAAAIHAGVIGPEGGDITVLRLPGQDRYEGTTANGVTTSDWGAYGTSLGVRAAN